MLFCHVYDIVELRVLYAYTTSVKLQLVYVIKVTQSIKERIEQGLQEHDATEVGILATPSTNSDSMKQYIGSLVNSLDKKSTQVSSLSFFIYILNNAR